MGGLLITTRPSGKAVEKDITSSCLEVVNCHLTEIRYLMEPGEVSRALETFGHTAIVFTSSVASSFAVRRLPPGDLSGKSIYCIGNASAAPLVEAGYHPLIPAKKDSSGLSDLVCSVAGKDEKVAIIRSDFGSEVLTNRLTSAGIDIFELKLYEIRKKIDPSIYGSLCRRDLIGVLVTSPMEARILSEIMRGINCGKTGITARFFAIGQPTREELERSGLAVSEPYGDSDVKSLVSRIEKVFC